jgi:hypothetical protein
MAHEATGTHLSVPLPDFGRRDVGEGSPSSAGPGPRSSLRKTGPGGRPGRGRQRPYRLTAEQVAAVRDLSDRIDQTLVELTGSSPSPEQITDAAFVARMQPTRLRALLSAKDIGDGALDTVGARPGHVRRPRRSTLVRVAAAFGLPEVVVDLWCSHCPDAIAREDPRS